MAPIGQAFVLAAGLGTRLRPLTDELPKPLVPIFQKPLITFALDHLIDVGVESFVINTHRLPEAFTDAFPKNCYREHEVTFVHEPVLLDTGGGIKNMEALLGKKPFITYSGDVLTDLPLGPLIEEHLARANDVTLALRKTGLGSAIALRNHRVVDIGNRYRTPGSYDFANIAVWNPAIFARVPSDQKVSFIPILADWISHGGKIGGVVLNEGNWFNLGSRAEYLEVHQRIGAGWLPYYIKETGWAAPIHPSATVDPTAQILGCTVIGANCRIGARARLEDTILWPGSQIASEGELVRCIVRSHKNVSGTHRETDI
jgi:NDP-sugar pyrophosphorylase family protein